MHKKILRDEALSLEGDGIIPKIYSLLTNKDPMFGTMPTIYLPHTVIFAFDIPEAWYFGNENGVRRKLKINITLENIEKAFLKDVPKCGIVAQFIEVGSEEKASPTTFTYILKSELRSFLQNKKPNGILQKFVAPKGLNNYVLKANWSPNFSLFEKVENNMKLDDDSIDVYQKAMTLEGKDYQIRTIPLRGSMLPQKLDKLAHALFHHIRKSTNENIIIARMTLIFKIDEEGKLWFLYCTSLRVQPEENQKRDSSYGLGNHVKPQDLNAVLLSPSNINAYKGAFVKIKSLKKMYKCLNCDKQLDSKQFFNISLRQVIHEFEKDRQVHYPESTKPKKQVQKSYGFLYKMHPKPEEMDVIDATIPKIVLTLYPELRHEEYEILKKEPGFLYREVPVCEDCYLEFSNDPEYVQIPKTIAKEFENFYPRGTGSLRPEMLEERRTKTKLHGKEFNDQLNSLLLTCKQKKFMPGVESSDASPSARLTRNVSESLLSTTLKKGSKEETSFNGSIRITMNRRKSQPKITEEDFLDRSDDRYEPTTVRAEPRAEAIFKKIVDSQFTTKGSQSNRSPQNMNSQTAYFKNFFKDIQKNNLFSDKFESNLPLVAPKTTKNRTSSQNKEQSPEKNKSANSTMINLKPSLKGASKIDDPDWKNLQSRSRARIMEVYGRTSSLKSFKNIKVESMLQDSRQSINL